MSFAKVPKTLHELHKLSLQTTDFCEASDSFSFQHCDHNSAEQWKHRANALKCAEKKHCEIASWHHDRHSCKRSIVKLGGRPRQESTKSLTRLQSQGFISHPTSPSMIMSCTKKLTSFFAVKSQVRRLPKLPVTHHWVTLGRQAS